ncbi:MAG: hypothetical protein Ta2A_16250 [Treponemataceae bacterium]|nr:MAG: hypothetical protein Ta2A_16250 [Treponemataceae bacterium]
MKTTKSGRKFCAILPLRISAGVLLALCTALTIVACKNPMIDEFLGYPKLTVTAPQFSEVVSGGYTPVARQIVILNVGKRAGGIKSVTVSPDTAFAIGPAGSSAVGSGKNIADWTVQPKANLPPGAHKATITVTYRGAGVDSAKATASVEFVVMPAAAPPPTAPTRILAVTAPTFASVTEGYTTRPAAQNITITNSGNSPATIASISVSPAGKFDVNTSAGTVNGSNASITRTVQPKDGLMRGTHMALITVTYNGSNGTTASALVSFEVTAPPGRFVAVADNSSKVAYSDNGSTWTAATLPSSEHWTSVTYGNGKFVAIAGGAGNFSDKAAHSFDGINWIAATLPSNKTWTSVTYGNGKFVAVSRFYDKAAYSADGITWAEATLPADANWQSVTYGNSKFVAVVHYSTSAAYSFDGITWTAATLPSNAAWYSTAYGNGKFVAVPEGGITAAYITGGIGNWTAAANLPQNVDWSVTYGNGRFVAVNYNNNTVAHSTNPATGWSSATIPGATNYWWSVAFGNGRFVAVGGTSSSQGAAYSADNGESWTAANMPSNAVWCSVTYGLVDR